MLRHARTAILPLVAASAALSACEEPGPIVVGVSTSTSYVDAARLALEHACADGFTIPVDTVMIPEHANQAAPAIRASQRFIAEPGLIAVVGHSNSAASLAASQLYNQSRVVQIAPTSSAVVYSRAGPYSFRLVPADDQQGAFLAGELARRLPAGGRAAVLYVNDDYGRGLRDALNAALGGTAVEIALELPFTENDLTEDEVAQTVATVANARPDLLVWLGRGSTLDRMLTGIREALGPVPVLGGDAVGTGKDGDEIDERWAGVEHAEYGDLDATPAGRRFRRDYEARFGRPATVPAALTYDAMRLFLDGIAAGARTGEQMRAYLHTLGRSRPPYPGVTGPVRFDDRGDVHGGFRMVDVPVAAPARESS